MKARYLCLLLLILLGAGEVAMARDAKGRFVVVLDAGHGGKDSGALGRKSKEKDIVLAVALQTGQRIKELNPNIVVHYTREKDVFLGLKERTDFANKKKADLFVSIHANAHRSRTPRGAETFVLGLHRTQDNLEVAMKENSAILYEENHSVKYEDFDPTSDESYIIFEFMQNRHLDASIELAERVQGGLVSCGLGNRGVKQAGFLVLREAAMPSILIELGFVSNPSDEAYLLSQKGKKQLANNIAKAVVNYESALSARSGRTSSASAKSVKNAEVKEEVKSGAVQEAGGETWYRVQVLADKRKLTSNAAAFKGYEQHVSYYKEGNFYKYTLYNTTDLAEAKRLQRELRKDKRYKDCFVVGFDSQGNKVGSYY